LFAKDAILKKSELAGTLGGNNSDVTYRDSKMGGNYDTLQTKLMDVHKSGRRDDKPALQQCVALDDGAFRLEE
jgi:hypothetical protein